MIYLCANKLCIISLSVIFCKKINITGIFRKCTNHGIIFVFLRCSWQVYSLSETSLRFKTRANNVCCSKNPITKDEKVKICGLELTIEN